MYCINIGYESSNVTIERLHQEYEERERDRMSKDSLLIVFCRSAESFSVSPDAFIFPVPSNKETPPPPFSLFLLLFFSTRAAFFVVEKEKKKEGKYFCFYMQLGCFRLFVFLIFLSLSCSLVFSFCLFYDEEKEPFALT